MLILIAESKTMAPCAEAVTDGYCRPLFDGIADEVMQSLRGADVAYLSNAVKISPAMAVRLQRMIYDFPNKTTVGEAITAFTGVVFRALDYRSLDEASRVRVDSDVRLVSSLYGWLRPDDIVKPYRFDFTTPLAPGGRTFSAFWRDRVTEALIADISAGGHADIIDLLPGDAARCIDWKRVGEKAGVWKVDFKEMMPGGAVRTPNANRLKILRGSLLRSIATENLTTPRDNATHLADDYLIETSPGLLTLTTVAG